VQPPGIDISPIADIDAPQVIVTQLLTTKSRAARPTNARRSTRVLVMQLPPEPLLVAAQWRAIEPLVHAPQRNEPPPVAGIAVAARALIEHERAHARPLADVGGRIRTAARRELIDGRRAAFQRPGALTTVVVVDAAFALLLLFAEVDAVVGVE